MFRQIPTIPSLDVINDQLFQPSILLMSDVEIMDYMSLSNKNDKILTEVDSNYVNRLKHQLDPKLCKKDYEQSLKKLSKEAINYILKKQSFDVSKKSRQNLPLLTVTRNISESPSQSYGSARTRQVSTGGLTRNGSSSKIKPRMRESKLNTETAEETSFSQFRSEPAVFNKSAFNGKLMRKTAVNLKCHEEMLNSCKLTSNKEKSDIGIMFEIVNLKATTAEGKKRMMDELLEQQKNGDFLNLLKECKKKVQHSSVPKTIKEKMWDFNRKDKEDFAGKIE